MVKLRDCFTDLLVSCHLVPLIDFKGLITWLWCCFEEEQIHSSILRSLLAVWNKDVWLEVQTVVSLSLVDSCVLTKLQAPIFSLF
jgi:hypothetical protein